MKLESLIFFGGLAYLAYVMFKDDGLLRTGMPMVSSMGAQEIANAALPGQNGYGWRYFTDGTAIDPQGNYYRDGARIWSPDYNGVNVGARYVSLAI